MFSVLFRRKTISLIVRLNRLFDCMPFIVISIETRFSCRVALRLIDLFDQL